MNELQQYLLIDIRYHNTKVLLFLTVILLVILPALICGAEESITVTTYYPSPYGVYSEMRLYPKLEAQATTCDQNHEGLMFYDRVMHAMRVCRCINTSCIMTDDFTYSATNYWTLSGTNLYPNDLAWKVGIGTMNPMSVLHVNTNAVSDQTLFSVGSPYGDTTNDNGMHFYAYTDENNYIDSKVGTSGRTFFRTGHGTESSWERTWMSVDAATGNVGIGTMGPLDEKLVVPAGAIKIDTASSVDNDGRGLVVNSDDDFLYDGQYLPQYSFGFHNYNEGAGNFVNAYISGWGGLDLFTGGAPRVRVMQNGNVGIGTTVPSAKLEVRGSGVGADLARLRIRSTDNQAGVFLFSDNTGEVGMYSPDGTDNLHLWAGGDRVVILSNGNIGIGQSPGNARLHINSNSMLATDYNIFTEYGGISLFNVKNSGSVGIGMVNPSAAARLDVAGEIHSTDTSTGFYLGGGAWVDNWARLTTNAGGVYHDLAIDNLWAAGALRFDLAEVTPVKKEDKLEQGDIVVVDKEDGLRVTRSAKSYDASLYGIVSSYEQAAMVIGGFGGPEAVMNAADKLPIALVGRALVKISTANGPIRVGDMITSSEIPGVGMKATQAGRVVGMALEAYSSKEIGKIMAFVNPHWWGDPLLKQQ